MKPIVRHLSAIAAFALASGAVAQQPKSLFAGRAVMPDGTIAQNVTIRLDQGAISAVSTDSEAPGGRNTVSHPDAVVCPGLIDVWSYLGVYGSNVERTKPVDQDLRILDAFNPNAPELRHALEQGITSALIVPSPRNVIGGTAAVVRTHTDGETPDVIDADGPLVVTLSESVLDVNLGPTSRAGALFLLRDAFENPPAESGPIVDAKNGKRPVVAFAQSGDDAISIVTTLSQYDIKPTLMHTVDAIELGRDLEGSVSSMILGPYGFATAPEVIAGSGAIARRDIPVVLRAGAPSVEAMGLRASAALASRYGLNPDAARRAITSGAAEAAGVGDTVGSLKSGLAADLVVFSEDPLRPDARVLEVYIRGVRVYAAPPTDPMDDPEVLYIGGAE